MRRGNYTPLVLTDKDDYGIVGYPAIETRNSSLPTVHKLAPIMAWPLDPNDVYTCAVEGGFLFWLNPVHSNEILVYDLMDTPVGTKPTLRPITTLAGHETPIGLVLSNSNGSVVSFDEASTMCVWRVDRNTTGSPASPASIRLHLTIPHHHLISGPIFSMNVSRTSIITAGRSGRVVVWSIDTGEPAHVIDVPESYVAGLVPGGNGLNGQDVVESAFHLVNVCVWENVVTVGLNSGVYFVWDTREGKCVRILRLENGNDRIVGHTETHVNEGGGPGNTDVVMEDFLALVDGSDIDLDMDALLDPLTPSAASPTTVSTASGVEVPPLSSIPTYFQPPSSHGEGYLSESPIQPPAPPPTPANATPLTSPVMTPLSSPVVSPTPSFEIQESSFESEGTYGGTVGDGESDLNWSMDAEMSVVDGNDDSSKGYGGMVGTVSDTMSDHDEDMDDTLLMESVHEFVPFVDSHGDQDSSTSLPQPAPHFTVPPPPPHPPPLNIAIPQPPTIHFAPMTLAEGPGIVLTNGRRRDEIVLWDTSQCEDDPVGRVRGSYRGRTKQEAPPCKVLSLPDVFDSWNQLHTDDHGSRITPLSPYLNNFTELRFAEICGRGGSCECVVGTVRRNRGAEDGREDDVLFQDATALGTTPDGMQATGNDGGIPVGTGSNTFSNIPPEFAFVVWDFSAEVNDQKRRESHPSTSTHNSLHGRLSEKARGKLTLTNSHQPHQQSKSRSQQQPSTVRTKMWERTKVGLIDGADVGDGEARELDLDLWVGWDVEVEEVL